jgi:hypothetical protein
VDEQGQRHRCRIPDIAIAEAQRARVDLVHACVLLDLESSGGLNIFSAPRSPGCGQPRGTAVTEQTWREYLARRDECESQGAGPMQLTWPPLADEADRQGGAWRPEVNVRVGLAEFARLLAGNTVRDAYSRWNTGKPGETVYATKAMGLLDRWQAVIDG